MSLIVGFALALLIGMTLGTLGGGGSILTVPVLVYVMGFEPKDAIAMSLPVVGTTSFVAAVEHSRVGNVDGRALLSFAPLAMLGAVVGGRLAAVVSGTMQLAILGVVMLVAGVLMLRGQAPEATRDASFVVAGARRHVLLAATGMGVGLLTGLAGVGGGFLIVPALVLVAGVPMKRAVGTSLVVIGLSTLSALAAYRGQVSISWGVVGLFTALAVAGAVVGTRAARRVPAGQLRRWFGMLVLVLALFTLYENRRIFTSREEVFARPERGSAR